MCVGEKGVLVHSAGRALYGYDLRTGRSFLVATTSTAVSVLDVDSSRAHVYWIDGSRMRRAMLNNNDSLTAPAQDLCTVFNASGIAYDWIARSVRSPSVSYWLPTAVLSSRACERSVRGAENRAERAENLVERRGAVSGRCRKTMERSGAERGAGGRGAGTERGAGVTEIRWSAERLFCRSRSAHML